MADNKTIKKHETPIDERETFVSLQKSFADSDLSVEEKLQVLYSLQQADNEIEKIKQLRGALPQEVAQIESELESYRAKIAHLEEVIEEYNNSMAASAQEIEEQNAEIAKFAAQLENISNSREYDSIQKDEENARLLLKIAEKHIGEARIAVAERREAIAEISDRIAIREEDLAAKQAELDGIAQSTADQEAELQAKRDAFAAKIDARTLSAYDRIRTSTHNHLAVVSVYNGDSCGGCFNTITPQRLVDIATGRKLVICEHCGRILVNVDAPAE